MPSFLSQSKLAAHEAITIAQSVLQELLRGICTPERAPSPVDAYLTEEDLFHYRNPKVWAGPVHSGYLVVANPYSLEAVLSTFLSRSPPHGNPTR